MAVGSLGMGVVPSSTPLTVHEAAPLKHAALGAARRAGSTELGSFMTACAREFNRAVRKGKRADQSALPVPAPGELSPVKAANVPLHARVLARELASMGLLSQPRIIGSAESDGSKPFRPLLAVKVGNSIRYKEVPESRD